MEISLNTNSLEYKELEIEILNDICLRSKLLYKSFEDKFKEIKNQIDLENNKIKLLEKEIENSNNNNKINNFDFNEDDIELLKEKELYLIITKELNIYEENLNNIIDNYEEKHLNEYKKYLKKLFSEKYENYIFEIIGSYKSKTNIIESNIDILVKFNNPNKNNVECSEDINIWFKKNNKIEIKSFIRNSSFQTILIFKFKDDPYKKSFTIFFPKENKYISIVNNNINEYIKDFPKLRLLVRIIKEIFYFGKLIEKNKNGITSYLLLLIIVSYFQFSFMKNINKKIDDSIGYHFINFLKFFVNFNYFNTYLDPNQPLNKINKGFSNPVKLKNIENFKNEFIITDPFNKKPNLINLKNNNIKIFQKIKDIFQLILFNLSIKKKNYLEDMMNIAYSYNEIKSNFK